MKILLLFAGVIIFIFALKRIAASAANETKSILDSVRAPSVSSTPLTPTQRDLLEQEYKQYLFEKSYYEFLFDRSPEELAGVPAHIGQIELDHDGFPRQVGSTDWGPAFTVYLTSRAEVFHRRKSCTKTGKPVHIFTIGRIKPCPKCNAKRLDDSWLISYRNIVSVMNYYGITPKPVPQKTSSKK